MVQVALPVVLTTLAGQSGLELPLTRNVTVPLGVIGDKVTPASWAVKVIDVLTCCGLAGDPFMLSEAAAALTVCDKVFEVLAL